MADETAKRDRRVAWGAAIALVLVIGAGSAWLVLIDPADEGVVPADPDNVVQVALGEHVYGDHCAHCHGERLEGEDDWHVRRPDGRLPAPPHDVTGHTWHHPDEVLFGMIKYGLEPYAPPDYQTDMPAFEEVLSDWEIWAVIAYIKSTWDDDIRAFQERITRRAEDAER